MEPNMGAICEFQHSPSSTQKIMQISSIHRMVVVDDIVEEILVRLPVKSLIRCKCLSKKWHHFISRNHYFHLTYLSRIKLATPTPTPHMLGFFYHQSLARKIFEPVQFLPTCTEGLKLKKGEETWGAPLFDDALSFLDQGQGQQIFVVASYSCFLLCCLQNTYPMDYFICNPVTRQWVALPKPNSEARYVNHILAIYDPNASYLSFDQIKYKVVRVLLRGAHINNASNTQEIEILSSESPKWTLLHRVSTSNLHFLTLYTPGMARQEGNIEESVFVFYWLAIVHDYIDRLVVFDPNEEFLDMVKVPGEVNFKGSTHCGQCNGSILYVKQDLIDLKVWVLEYKDNGDRQWSLRQRVSLQIPLQIYSGFVGSNINFQTRAIHPTDPRLLFIYGSKKMVLFNLENSSMQLVCDFLARGWNRCYDFFLYVWPHWPPFFP